MAQSSNYKQYARTTRVLTEESGFAGGMLWTGNNIDEAHLKAIVNCDYDDTTGYLKARDPFIKTSDSPNETDFADLDIDLSNYSLLSTYSICAFDVSNDDSLLGAGDLYIFARTVFSVNEYSVDVNKNNIKCVYRVDEDYYLCDMPEVDDYSVTLRSINNTNFLHLYENQLYGLGQSANDSEQWLHVYRIEKSVLSTDEDEVVTYSLVPLSYTDYIKPKIDSVGLLEAGVSGFNAARGENTFKYDSVQIESEEQPYIVGVYFTDESGTVLVSPPLDKPVKVHVPVAYVSGMEGNSCLAMFQLKEGGEANTTNLEDSWSYVTAGTLDVDTDMFVFDFRFQKKRTTLGFTYYGTNLDIADTTVPPAYSDDAVDYLMPYVVTAGDSHSNLKVKHYDLSGAYGSCIWKNRMCLWGTQSSHNCLFLSDVDNFYYYPIPHNVALFDTSVISCIPYKDTLLVFTADKIYRVSENNDGSFAQTVIQQDMPLTRKDAPHLTAIKNMVLFKSGNYFYMIVPKSQSLTDELSIAPIYKNIAGFLNMLDKSTQEVLQLVYPEYLFTKCSVANQAPTTVYAEQDTVHILYNVVATVKVKTENALEAKTFSFKMFLNYNTNLRAWTLYLEDTTTASLDVAMLNASRIMSFVRIHNNGTFSIVTQQPVTSGSDFRILIDTGYRTLSSTTQKRFREVQLKLYNTAESITAFGTAFLVDGVWRRNYSKLQEVTLENNVISLMPTLDLNTFVTELTMPVDTTGNIIKDPGSDSIELSDWTLDFSHFKREAPVTIRVPVSGKGFNPRFIFMTPNAAGLTINEINWVYRLMHGR